MADPDYAGAISGIESGGKYDLLGPETRGDRAYGKYQIMGNNIGPWSKEILGQEVTPEQFLANPQLQDAVFQGKFGQYVNKYGPEGAAKAWFAGEKGMNNPNAKDVLGTSVAGYGAKFMRGLGQPAGESVPPQAPSAPPMQLAPMGGAPAPVQSQPSAPLDLASFRQAAYSAPTGMPAFPWSPGQGGGQGPGMQGAGLQGAGMQAPQMLQAPPINYYRPQLARRGFSFPRG